MTTFSEFTKQGNQLKNGDVVQDRWGKQHEVHSVNDNMISTYTLSNDMIHKSKVLYVVSVS